MFSNTYYVTFGDHQLPFLNPIQVDIADTEVKFISHANIKLIQNAVILYRELPLNMYTSFYFV